MQVRHRQQHKKKRKCHGLVDLVVVNKGVQLVGHEKKMQESTRKGKVIDGLRLEWEGSSRDKKKRKGVGGVRLGEEARGYMGFRAVEHRR